MLGNVLRPPFQIHWMIHHTLAALAIALMTMSTPPALARGIYAQAVADTTVDESLPAVAHGSSGFLVIWEHAYSLSDHDIYLRRVSATGTPLDVPVAVVTSGRWEGAPSAAFSSATESFLVVWEEVNVAGDSDIMAQRYGADGVAVGELIAVATGSTEQRRPAVAGSSDRWLVLWEHETTPNPLNIDIRGLLVDDTGSVVGSELVLASGSADERAPAAAWGSDSFLVAWQDPAAGDNDIRARTVDLAGALGDVSTLVSWEYDQFAPALAFSPQDSSFLVVWEDHHWGFGADWDIYGRRVSSAGATLGDLISISWVGSSPRSNPTIAYNSGNAEYQVVWEYEIAVGNRDLYRRRVGPSGSLLGDETALAELSSEETAPAVAGDGIFGTLVVWEDRRNSGVSGIDIYAELVEQFRLSGRVYAGAEGDASTPLQDATVELYCSNSSGVRETLSASTTSNASGWWGIAVTDACDFFELWLVDPQYYIADGATSVGGAVLSPTWIEYAWPLRGTTLTGNLFFTVPQNPAPEPWENFSPAGWWSSALTVTVSAQISDFGSGLDVSSAEIQSSFDGGGSWQPWNAASCTGSDGSNGPETVSSSVLFPGDNDTEYLVQFAISDLAAQRSESPTYPVKVDTTLPENPEGVGSNLSTSTWYGDPAITLDWVPGSDATSGVAGYSLLWDSFASTVPDGSVDETDNHIEDSIPGEGQSWYFHLRTVDHAGNAASGARHTGPYWLDTTSPSNPTSITCTPLPNTWSSSSTVSCSWNAGTDSASGIAGYSVAWDTSASTLPNSVIDTSNTSATSQSLSSGAWYLHLRSVDDAGNGASAAVHAGPFTIDRDPPSSAVNPLATNQTTTSFTVSWGGSDGTGSGIAMYDVKVEDLTSSSTTTLMSGTTLSSTIFTGVRGHTYLFSSRAVDNVGNQEAYPAAGGDALTTVGASIPIRVKDEGGANLSGAKVYHNGSLAGLTDGSGLHYVSKAVVGDTVSALHQVHQQSAPKASHGGWSYRVYLTSVGIDNAGNTSVHSITSGAEQLLTVRKNQPLIGVHMLATVEWDATTSFLSDVQTGLGNASTYLYDATDGQFFWDTIELKDNSVDLANADLRIYATNQVWPNASLGGLGDGAGKLIHLGRLFNGNSSNRGNWSQANGFRTMIHEFGHYLGLWDEYLTRSGKKDSTAFCATNFDTHATAGRASVMFYQYTATEFCSRADSTHTHRSQTLHDAKTGGESTWESLKRMYADSSSPARWTLRSPDDRGTIVDGPTAIPVSGWSTTILSNANTSACATFTETLFHADTGAPAEGAEIWLDRSGSTPDLRQGKTDANGQIVIYGAHNGDILRSSLNGASTSGSVSCSPASAPTLKQSLALEPDPFTLSARLFPMGGDNVQVVIRASTTLAEAPAVALWQQGADAAITLTVAWAPGEVAWLATTDLASSLDRSGQLQVAATDLEAHTVYALQSFALVTAGPADPPRIYSRAGDFELLLDEGSLGTEVVIGVQEVDAGSQHQGALTRLGDSYLVSLSGGTDELLQPAVINVRYQGDLATELIPSSLQLYRWDELGEQWLPVADSVSDPDFNIVSAEVSQLSLFAVLGVKDDEIFSDGFETGDTTSWSGGSRSR